MIPSKELLEYSKARLREDASFGEVVQEIRQLTEGEYSLRDAIFLVDRVRKNMDANKP